LEMCREEGVNLQRGMNFGSGGRPSVILMSRRPGAPYDDRIEEDGRVLIYEGHDTPQARGDADPKTLDQPERGPGGTLTQNGLFLQVASQHREVPRGVPPAPQRGRELRRAVCHEPINYRLCWPPPRSFTVDHREPVRSRPDLALSPANFQPCHARCNRSRAYAADPEEDDRGLGIPSENW
jgi:hypothetical protein